MKHYSGQYANFSYPGAYVEKRHDLPENNPVKETIFLSAVDFEGRKIAITVEERPEKDFEASPSFQMRMNKPKEYEKSPLSDAGLRGFFFMKKTAVYEQDAFFFAKGFLVSVAVVSPTTADGLRDELLGILKSFVVKK